MSTHRKKSVFTKSAMNLVGLYVKIEGELANSSA